jgi:hypothetical protein
MIGQTSSTQVGQELRIGDRIRIFAVLDDSASPVEGKQEGPQP